MAKSVQMVANPDNLEWRLLIETDSGEKITIPIKETFEKDDHITREMVSKWLLKNCV